MHISCFAVYISIYFQVLAFYESSVSFSLGTEWVFGFDDFVLL